MNAWCGGICAAKSLPDKLTILVSYPVAPQNRRFEILEVP
jgi:hypothetical protein